MTRISSYDLHICPECQCEHILPKYASISLTPAYDAYVPPEDLRVCARCGAVKPFREFVFTGTKQKPVPDFTPEFVKFFKRLLGVGHPVVEPHPTVVYPYLTSKVVEIGNLDDVHK